MSVYKKQMIQMKIVSAVIGKGGQYFLAYNEFIPQFTDFQFTQLGEDIQFSVNVKDSFEALSIEDLSVIVNGRKLTITATAYHPASGKLTLMLKI